MPIVVGHDVPMTATGPAAYKVGKGQNARYLIENAQRNADRRMEMIRLKAQQDAQRDAKREAEARFQATLQQHQQDQLFQALQSDRRFQEAAQAREDMAGREVLKSALETEQRKDLFDYEFTAKQRQELQQLADAEDWVATTPMTSYDRQQFRMALAAKQAGIQPHLFPKQKPQTFPNGHIVGDVWTLPNGVMVAQDPDGKVSKLYEPKAEKAQRDYDEELLAKMRKERVQTVIDLMKITDKNIKGEDVPRFTLEEAIQYANQLYPELANEPIVMGAGGGGGTGRIQAPEGIPAFISVLIHGTPK